MKGYAFELCCPHCGGETELLAASTSRITSTSAIVKCLTSRCRREQHVRVVLEPAPRPESIRRRERAA